jgi:hypothetical protein
VIVVSSEEELLKDLQEDSNSRRGGKIMCALCDPLDGDAMATLELDVTNNIGLPDVSPIPYTLYPGSCTKFETPSPKCRVMARR